MTALERVSLQLLNALQAEVTDKRRIYKEFLQKCKNSTILPESQCSNFKEGLYWINTPEPLSLNGNLKGKVIVLDFWTYCCINCMHILPDLHALEQKFSIEDGVVVIGVHSGKFPNEKVDENIANAVHRYGMSHAVVNDRDMTMWFELGIQCWPTIVIIGPDGQLLNQYVGEGHRQALLEFVECTLEVYADTLNHNSLPIAIGQSVSPSSLFYPTKVLAQDNELIISDSGHHRVIICTLNGNVKAVVGTGEAGTSDGSFINSSFRAPQGLCRQGQVIYVADSDAHLIRAIDTSKGNVSTIAGAGIQGDDKDGGKKGQLQVLSSPWDVKFYQRKTSLADCDESEELLLIAMAGSHQIWALCLTQLHWWKGKVYDEDTCAAIVGSGAEENRNNSYPMKAGLAQPSGLSIDSVGELCYIADSESSTIRQLSLADGKVKGMAGGALDPKDLFAYGDVDGKGVTAKLQHPLDICHIPNSDHVVICDSYNHKLKLLDTKTREVTTLLVCGLNEPGGLSFHEPSRSLYIADTNNHCIKRVHLPDPLDPLLSLTAEKLSIHVVMAESPQSLFTSDKFRRSVVKTTNELIKIGACDTSVTVQFKLAEDCEMTDEVESAFLAIPMEGSTPAGGPICGTPTTSAAAPHILDLNIDLSLQAEPFSSLSIELLAYFCNAKSRTCKRKCVRIMQPIEREEYVPEEQEPVNEEGMGEEIGEEQVDNLEDGMNDGIEDGNDDGIEDGNDDGIEDGNDDGIEDGNDDGIEDGNDDCIEDGNDDGMNDGMEDEMNDGMDDEENVDG
ncbi:NHL repeat-containing protein 2-like [Watersipora subatra]|uniref:NHL repeat-containing protein 2-like n=1 Tax=Watersipora subatra TaxID=2589382 RepID=UPI00355B3507